MTDTFESRYGQGPVAPGPILSLPLPAALGGSELRFVVRDGEVWFVAADFADLLGYSHVPHMVRMLDDDEKGVHKVDTLGGQQSVNIVSESGLYTLIVKSTRPEAKPFRRWVTHEVLPSIARTGSYSDLHNKMGEALGQATGDAINLAINTASQTERLSRLVDMVASVNSTVAGMVDAMSAMQITQQRSVQSHSRQIARAFRLAEMRQPVAPSAVNGDPDRKLSKAEREKALHMFRSGVPFARISSRLNRTHKVIERWAASEPEVIRSLVGRGLF